MLAIMKTCIGSVFFLLLFIGKWISFDRQNNETFSCVYCMQDRKRGVWNIWLDRCRCTVLYCTAVHIHSHAFGKRKSTSEQDDGYAEKQESSVRDVVWNLQENRVTRGKDCI